jgi:hypothetical protein
MNSAQAGEAKRFIESHTDIPVYFVSHKKVLYLNRKYGSQQLSVRSYVFGMYMIKKFISPYDYQTA